MNPELVNERQFSIERTIEVDAKADRVWYVLTEEFGDANVWASSVHEAVLTLPDDGDLYGAKRVCQTDLGEIHEEVVTYDVEKMNFAYSAAGVPMLESAVNNWSVESLGDDRAILKMRLEMETVAGADPLMVEGMKQNIGGVLQNAIEELKHFVETGEAHPRKLAVQQ